MAYKEEQVQEQEQQTQIAISIPSIDRLAVFILNVHQYTHVRLNEVHEKECDVLCT